MNRKQRRQMYKKFPKLRDAMKKQKKQMMEKVETAFQRKWKEGNQIQSENEKTGSNSFDDILN